MTTTPISLAMAALLSAAPPAPSAPTTTSTTAPATTTAAAPTFRDTKPITAARKATPLPRPHTWHDAASGLDVTLIEAHELPTVTLGLVFETGAVDDPVTKPGLTSLALTLMSQGTLTLDKIAFEER